MKTRYSALTLIITILSATQMAAQKLPDCGFENGRTCHPFDNEFWVNGGGACDRGLKIDTKNFFKQEDDICVDDVRHEQSKDYTWVGWALSQQRYNIGGDQPINWITHLNAHNAYNNAADGFDFPNQKFSITSLLNLGARSLALDLHWYDRQLRLCHGKDTNSVGCTSFDRLYAYAIQEIANWLDENPGEVIVVEFENNAQSHDDHVNSPISEYLGSKVWRPSTSAAHGITGRYPTMNEIRNAGKQILLQGDDIDGDWVFPVDDNSYGSKRAKNAKPASCVSDTTNLIPQHNKWLNVYEARSEGDRFDPSGTLNEEAVAQLTRCGISSIGLDFITALHAASLTYMRVDPPDTRREAMVWSWAENDSGANGNLALFRSNDGRWTSRNGNNLVEKHPFACALPRTGDPKEWKDAGQESWWITPTEGIWFDGPGQCADYGKQIQKPLVFAAPASGRANEKLRKTAGPNRGIWINNTIRPIPNPVLTPAILGFLVSEGRGAEVTTKDFTIWGTRNSQLSFSKTTASGGDWLRVTPTSDRIGDHGTVVHVSIVPEVVKTLKRGTYTGSIKVTPVNSPGLTERVLFVSLYVKVPTDMELTNTPALTDQLTEVVFKAKLKYVQTSTFRATGMIELREQLQDPATGNKSVITLGSQIVNSTAHGSSAPDNEVTFKLTNLKPGEHQIAAYYVGDNEYGSSLSNAVTHTVRFAPQTALSSQPLRISAPGQQIDLTVTMTPRPNGPPVTGTVYFYDGSSFLGQTTLVDQKAHWPVRNPRPGAHLFMAAYLKNGVYDGNGSNLLEHWVGSPTPVTITANPPGAEVLVDGVRYETPVSFNWVLGDTHVLAGVPINTAQHIRTFTRWSDGATGARSVDVRETPLQFTAQYADRFRVDSEPSQTGVIAVEPHSPTQFYAKGATLTARAQPRTAYSFKAFHGDVSSTKNPQTFVVQKYTLLRAEYVPSMSVFVSLSPADKPYFVDGVRYTGRREFLWGQGSVHTISAPAVVPDTLESEYRFNSWFMGGAAQSGNEISVTATPGANVISGGYFIKNKMTATATSGGSVRIAPPSPDGYYPNGTTVTFTAIPNAGFRFVRFTGSLTGSVNPQSIGTIVPRTVVAEFAPDTSAPLAPPVFAISIAAKSGTAEQRKWSIQIEQTAGSPASAAALTGVAFKQTGGAICTSAPLVLTPLPVASGPLNAGKASIDVIVNFSGCPPAARFEAEFRVAASGAAQTVSLQNQFR